MRSMNRPCYPWPGPDGPRARRAHATPLPRPRGPISGALITLLTGPPTRDAGTLASSYVTDLWRLDDDLPWWDVDADAALALVHLDELSRRGLEGVDDGWEGHPLLATARWTLAAPIRRGLERLGETIELPPRVGGCGVVRLVVAMATASTTPPPPDRRPPSEEVAAAAVQRLRERDARAALIPGLAGASRQLLARTVAGAPDDGAVDTERESVAAVLRGLRLPDRTGSHLDALSRAELWRLAVLDHLVAHRSLQAAALGWLATADALAAAGRLVTGEELRLLGLDVGTSQAWEASVVGRMTTLEATERLVDADPRLGSDVLLGARACVTAAAAVENERAHADMEADDLNDPRTDLTPMEGL